MLTIVILFLIAVVAVLWRLGGWDRAKWTGYRDVLVPAIIGLWYFFTYAWWVGILTAGASNLIRLGYGRYDPEHDPKPSWLAKITKDREGWRIRGIYGAITSFAIGLFPAVYMAFLDHEFDGTYLVRFFFYVAMNTGIEIALNKGPANAWFTEILNGAGRGSVLLWVR